MKTFKEYLLEVPSDYIIYFDMDGVLADFVERIEAVTGESVDAITKDQVAFKKLKAELVANDFFTTLKPMDGVKLLKELVRDKYNVQILTSVSKFESSKVAVQKKAWLKKHVGFVPPFNYTTSSVDKAKYAKSNTILITILHKSYQSTKKQLLTILESNRG
jgi:5'(3')-deoxyribonucleotidase